MIDKDTIPKHWEIKQLSDIGEIISGGTPSTKVPSYWNGNISWITPADLSGYSEKSICRGKKSITEQGLKNSSARLMPKNSVLFSSRAPIGYVVISSNELCTNQGFKSIVPGKSVNVEFLFYYLKSSKNIAENAASGTTFKEISSKKFSKLEIPLPPLSEQQQIVSKIEELFSELDKGKQQLDTVKQQFKTYRQAVLKWAFEGRFKQNTEYWRQTTLGEIISISSGINLSKSKRDDKGDFLVYGGNGPTGRHSEYMFEDEKFIIGRVGAHCGNAHITKPKSWITDNAFVVSFNKDEIYIRFLLYLINFLELNNYSSSTAQPVISQGKIYPIGILLPPLDEQLNVTREIETRLSVCDKMEETIENSLRQVESLRQSILKQAFEGKLL